MAIIQERDDDGGSDQARRGGGGEKWLGSGCIWKTEQTEFADILYLVREKEKSQ